MLIKLELFSWSAQEAQCSCSNYCPSSRWSSPFFFFYVALYHKHVSHNLAERIQLICISVRISWNCWNVHARKKKNNICQLCEACILMQKKVNYHLMWNPKRRWAKIHFGIKTRIDAGIEFLKRYLLSKSCSPQPVVRVWILCKDTSGKCTSVRWALKARQKPYLEKSPKSDFVHYTFHIHYR